MDDKYIACNTYMANGHSMHSDKYRIAIDYRPNSDISYILQKDIRQIDMNAILGLAIYLVTILAIACIVLYKSR